MDITKITFNETKYNATFDELDVNKDGVINNADAEAATDNTVKNTILQALADADEDPEVTDETDNTTGETTPAAAKTEADITKAADDLKGKYSNFAEAVNGDFVKTLSDQGFTPIDIVNVVAKAYPEAGIRANDNGGYTCPWGHGEEEKAMYTKFIDELNKVTGADVKALQAEVAKLNLEITNNNAKLTKLKGTIDTLKNEVEKAIEDAIKDSEEIKEEQKKEAADIVKEELDDYANSEGKVTYDEFQSNIKTRLDSLEGDGSGKMAAVMAKLFRAESKMASLKSCISQFGALVDANKTLADKIKGDEKKIEEAEDCPGCEPQRCDPIGFESNGVKYDFFVDKDNNGDITNETEFLGAENGWAEMAALDTDGDGKVESEEMKGLKMIATDADGKQTVVDASELFNDENDSIDLASYKEVNQDFKNGNTLLGTFSVNIDGNEIKDGYNTLDKLSWLDDNYAFTDEAAGINRFSKGNTETFDIADFSKEYTEYQTAFEEMNTKLDNAWNKVGITRADIADNVLKANEKHAKDEAEEIAKKFKTELGKEDPKAETPEDTTPPEEDPTKKPEEEA